VVIVKSGVPAVGQPNDIPQPLPHLVHSLLPLIPRTGTKLKEEEVGDGLLGKRILLHKNSHETPRYLRTARLVAVVGADAGLHGCPALTSTLSDLL
jgi:hypothetical protein